MKEKRDEIRVIVSGDQGIGKTGLMYLLEETLKEKGFDVEHTYEMDYPTEEIYKKTMGMYLDRRLNYIKKNSKIVFEEKRIIKLKK